MFSRWFGPLLVLFITITFGWMLSSGPAIAGDARDCHLLPTNNLRASGSIAHLPESNVVQLQGSFLESHFRFSHLQLPHFHESTQMIVATQSSISSKRTNVYTTSNSNRKQHDRTF